MISTHFNLNLNLCQESQNPRILSRDFSQPDQSGSDTDRQTDRCSTYGRSKPRREVDLDNTQIKQKYKIHTILGTVTGLSNESMESVYNRCLYFWDNVYIQMNCCFPFNLIIYEVKVKSAWQMRKVVLHCGAELWAELAYSFSQCLPHRYHILSEGFKKNIKPFKVGVSYKLGWMLLLKTDWTRVGWEEAGQTHVQFV